MILDNVDDMETFFTALVETPSAASKRVALSTSVPRSPKWKVVVTTRDSRVGERLTDRKKCITVPLLAEHEAVRLLYSKLSGYSNCTEADAAILVKTLDRLPLAITQAAAFISENYCTIRDYLEMLQSGDSDQIELLSKDLYDPRRDMDAPSSVVRTWKLSYDQIRTQKPRAAEMLALMAVLDRQGIPKSLLRRDDELSIEFITSIGVLLSFSLIEAEKGGDVFVMHRLVQLCMQSWLDMANKAETYRTEAMEIISRKFPTGEHGNWDACKLLLPHARKVQGYRYTSKDDQLNFSNLCHNMSWYDWSQGQYGMASDLAEAALKVRTEFLGHTDSATLASLVLLASVLRDMGKYEAAEEMNRRALEGRENVLGGDHPDTLTSVSNLASVLQAQGKYEAAEEMNRRALEGRENVLGGDHPDTLMSVGSL